MKIIEGIYGVYFSPTETSKKSVVSIAEQINPRFEEIDLTILNQNLSKTLFTKDEMVVFGGPVYGGRLFQGHCSQLRRLHGENTPCIITVSYGNRDYDDALLEMYNIVKEQGFIPFAAAALVCEHTYGKVQVGRPNKEDLLQNQSFAKEAYKKLQSGDLDNLNVPGKKPYQTGGTGGKFRPQTDREKCIYCGLCASNCPSGAISLENYAEINNDKCIACFRCIKNCPVYAKNMNTEEYLVFAESFSKKLSEPKKNQYWL